MNATSSPLKRIGLRACPVVSLSAPPHDISEVDAQMNSRACRQFILLAFATMLVGALPAAVAAQSIVGTVQSPSGAPINDVAVQSQSSITLARTDRTGFFRLHLPAGAHVVHFRRIGYEARQLTVQVDASGKTDTLRVVLTPSPHELKGLVVRGDQDHPTALTLSSQTLRNAPALGEADAFRSLPLLPSISQPNDVINVIHLAGGASDEAAITLGGHPLQSPFHAGNVFGALNVAALSKASVLMHHIPAKSDGYLSGEIALVPRRVESQPTRELVISLLSASATVTQPIGESFGILASARTTYIDQVLKAISRKSASDDLGLPTFRDLLVQLDGKHANSWTWSLVGYGMHNAAQSSGRPDEEPLELREGMLGLRVGHTRGSWNTEARLSVDQNRVGNAAYSRAIDESFTIRDNLIDQRWITGELDVSYSGSGWNVRSGLLTRGRRHRFNWSSEFVDLAINTPVASPIDTVMSQTRVGASTEVSVLLSRTTSISAASHISLVNGAAYPAPRVTFDWRPAQQLSINAALNRRFQFDAVTGVPREVSTTQPVFFLDRPRRADVASLSLGWNPSRFRWFDKAQVNTSFYLKNYHDRTLLQLPGITDADLPTTPASIGFDRGAGDVKGASLSVELATPRRLSLYGTYTWQRVNEVVNGQRQPATWDVPHELSLYASWSLSRRLTFNSVFQAHSGPAATPIVYRVLVPLQFGYGQRYVYGTPNSARFPGYRRADASLAYRWRFNEAEWEVSAQVINLFARPNGIQYYLPSFLECTQGRQGCADKGATQRSLPVLPSIGLGVRW
jgi:hypothetical protein